MHLQVTFHGLPHSAGLERRVRQSVGKLERFFERIRSCRVAIEAPHRHHARGGHYRIRVEVGAQNGVFVATDSRPNPYVGVRDAFEQITRQLGTLKNRARDLTRRERRGHSKDSGASGRTSSSITNENSLPPPA